MIVSTFSRRKLLVALVLSSVTMIGVYSARVFATPAPPTLQTARASELALEDITLGNPAAAAQVTRAQAERTVLTEFPGSQIRESVLAQLHAQRMPSAAHRLCWVVSIVPPGGLWQPSSGAPGNQARIPADYFLLFVDAQTGQYLFGTMGHVP
jgi:hypothetical protein